LGQNMDRKGLTDVRKILSDLEETRAIVCKRNRFDIFCRLSKIHERDRQTNRQRDKQSER